MVPRNLKHQPLMVVEQYEDMDGYRAGDSDAKGLSLGIAQWNPKEISVKVWRYADKGEKWSRQSEELPLHRNLDLTILLLVAFIVAKNPDLLKSTGTTKIENTFNKTTIINGNFKIEVKLERPEKAKEFIGKYYESLYKERLKTLFDLIGVLI
ncbi:DUF6530 family protein [Bacillus sp. FJAT-49736]|uniref:DUF6530 family protein n=1 Tax=Bacillus sp. FJAT-49736 TaxID=2833582 RepID=UPI00201628C4|nr:DUF6530 family protein [Bacillus sp. FJAT-49736]